MNEEKQKGSSAYALFNFVYLFFVQLFLVVPWSMACGNMNVAYASALLAVVTFILGFRSFFENREFVFSEYFHDKHQRMSRISFILFGIGLPIIYFHSFWLYLIYMTIISITSHVLFYPRKIEVIQR